MLKLDDAFGKLKKAESKYYGYLDELKNGEISVPHKSKQHGKNTLMNFVKPKGEQVNTLQNYNFKISKRRDSHHTKLMKGKEYEDFDRVLYELRREQSKIVYAVEVERPFKDEIKLERERPEQSE